MSHRMQGSEPMNLPRRAVLTAMLAGLVLPARAAEASLRYEGFDFARRVQVAGEELLLNGVGVRAAAWFKGYAAGLYLKSLTRSEGLAVSQPGPKRLQLRMLHDVPAGEFVKALRTGIERNAAGAEQAALVPQVHQFAELVAAIGTVRRGDAVDVDLDPARGLLLALNGTSRGPALPGTGLYAALLRAFLGDRPYDKRLKAGLLAGA